VGARSARLAARPADALHRPAVGGHGLRLWVVSTDEALMIVLHMCDTARLPAPNFRAGIDHYILAEVGETRLRRANSY